MKVLLVHNDSVIGDMIAMYLTEEGCDVLKVNNGVDGIEAIPGFNPAVVVIDYVLKETNGIAVCKEIRQFSMLPIILISTNTKVSNRIDAYMAGADEYLCKPFSMKELAAKVVAQLHKYQQVCPDERRNDDAHGEYIQIDYEHRTIKVNGQDIGATFSELKIMRLLSNSPGRVFSREELIQYLRRSRMLATERTIDVHIANLRNKIEKDPKNPRYIKTVWGIGYKYSLS